MGRSATTPQRQRELEYGVRKSQPQRHRPLATGAVEGQGPYLPRTVRVWRAGCSPHGKQPAVAAAVLVGKDDLDNLPLVRDRPRHPPR